MTKTPAVDEQLIGRLMELDAARTQGEWHLEPRKYQQNQMVESSEIGPSDSRSRSIATVWKRDGFKDARPNAAFIAAAPQMMQAIRDLMAEREQLRQEVVCLSNTRGAVLVERDIANIRTAEVEREREQLRAAVQRWQPMSTVPDCDDELWFCRGDTFEGPRAPRMDDVDYWDWWCYAKPPALPEALHQTGAGR